MEPINGIYNSRICSRCFTYVSRNGCLFSSSSSQGSVVGTYHQYNIRSNTVLHQTHHPSAIPPSLCAPTKNEHGHVRINLRSHRHSFRILSDHHRFQHIYLSSTREILEYICRRKLLQHQCYDEGDRVVQRSFRYSYSGASDSIHRETTGSREEKDRNLYSSGQWCAVSIRPPPSSLSLLFIRIFSARKDVADAVSRPNLRSSSIRCQQ